MKANTAKAGLEMNLCAAVQGQGPSSAPEGKYQDGTGHVYINRPHKLSINKSALLREIFINDKIYI